MKQLFLNSSISLIQKSNNYSEEKLAELRYGLETFYTMITKLGTIFILAALFHLLKELLLFLIFYTPLRSLGFGFHANNSIECWIISVPIFLLLPFLAKIIILPNIISIIIMALSTISFLLFAPADTKKKPLINHKKRLINKSLVVIISIFYLYTPLFIQNQVIINTITYACLWQAICVNPLLYALFKQPYNNYKKYIKEV